MAVYLIRNYLAGVADIRFYAKVLVMSFIMLAVLFSLSTFVSDGIVTLIRTPLLGEQFFSCVYAALGC